jgi:hypothetical protein
MYRTRGRIGESSHLWYDATKEAVVIELTEEQRHQLMNGQAVDVAEPQTALSSSTQEVWLRSK